MRAEFYVESPQILRRYDDYDLRAIISCKHDEVARSGAFLISIDLLVLTDTKGIK